MSSSAISTQVAQLKIGNVQNQADTSAVYNAGNWSFKNSTALTSVTITDSGNVGIGTASPTYRLQVARDGGGGDSAQFVRISDTSTVNAVGPMHLTIGAINHFAGNPSMALAGSNGISFCVGDGSDFNAQRKMFIDASGNLLVGTTGVLGTSAAGSSHIVGGTNGDTTPLYLRNAVSTAGRYWKTGPSSTAAFIVYNDANNGAYLSYGGTSWIANSDERMKKNIKPLELGLKQIKALKPARFDYNSDESEESSRVGFIAQEVLPILPHAVSVPEDSEQMMGVSATEMIPVLVKAIQELEARLAALESK